MPLHDHCFEVLMENSENPGAKEKVFLLPSSYVSSATMDLKYLVHTPLGSVSMQELYFLNS